jgi:hypothetical protein
MEGRIVQVERVLDLAGLAAGVILLLGWPEQRVALTRPMMLVWAGVALLGAGLARDLARVALGEPRGATTPDPHPGELRTCLESTLGLGAVAAGLAWLLGGTGGAPVLVPVGGLVLALAAVAGFGHLTRNLVLVLRHEPGHRNVTFWSPPRR